MKKIVVVFVLFICILLVSCASESKQLGDDTPDENVEIEEGLDDLNDLDQLDSDLEDISFDDLDNLELE